MKSQVANLSGGVETEDGRTLFGLDAELYMKMKRKEDPDFERKVGEWIEDVLGESLEDTSNLWQCLKSGVVLCRLVNAIKPNAIRKYNSKSKLHVLMERENINLYLDACWRMGVAKSDIFITSDLHGRRNMNSVLNNIIALSRTSKKFGVKVKPMGPSAVSLANKKPPKWDVVTNEAPINVQELGDDIGSLYKESITKLKMAELKISQLENSTNALKKDLSEKREQLRQATGNVGAAASSTKMKMELLDLKRELARARRELAEEKLLRSGLEKKLESALASLNTDKEGERVLELKKELAERVKEVEDLSSQLSDAQLESKKSKQKSDRLRRQSDIFQSQKKRESSLTNEDYVEQLEKDVSSLSQDKEDLMSRVRELTEEAKQLSKMSNSQSLELQDQVDEKGIRIRKLLKIISENEAALSLSANSVERLERQFNELQKAVSSQKSELDRERKNLAEATRQKEKFEDLQKKTEVRYEKAVNENNEKAAQIALLQKQSSASKGASTDTEELASAIRRAKIAEAKAEIAVNKLSTAQVSLQENLKTLRWERDELRDDLERSERNHRETQNDLNQLVQEMEEKEDRVSKIVDSQRDLKLQLQEYEMQITDSNTLNERLKKTISSVRSEVEQLKKENSTLSSQKNALSSVSSKLQAQTELVKTLRSRLTSQQAPNVSRLQSELDQFREKLAQKDRELELAKLKQIADEDHHNVQIENLKRQIGHLKRRTVNQEERENGLRMSQKAQLTHQKSRAVLLSNETSVLNQQVILLRRAELKLTQQLDKSMRVNREKTREIDLLTKDIRRLNPKYVLPSNSGRTPTDENMPPSSPPSRPSIHAPKDFPQASVSTPTIMTPTRLSPGGGSSNPNSARNSAKKPKKMPKVPGETEEGDDPIKIAQEEKKRLDEEANDLMPKPAKKLKKDEYQRALSLKEFSRAMSHDSAERQLFKRIRDDINKYIFGHILVDQSELAYLTMMVGTDAGRRVFFYTLQKFVESGKKQHTEIDPNAFVLLVEIIQKTLDVLDLTNGADYICGKILLGICRSLFKKSTSRDFLQVSIMSHYAWQNLFFWEEYFWDKMSETIPWTLYPGQDVSYTKDQKEQLRKQMKSFADQMIGWGNLPSAAIQLFLSNVARDMQFDDVVTLDKLNLYVDKKDAELKRNSFRNAKSPRGSKKGSRKSDRGDKDKQKEKEKEKLVDDRIISMKSDSKLMPPPKSLPKPKTHSQSSSAISAIKISPRVRQADKPLPKPTASTGRVRKGSDTESRRDLFAISKDAPPISPRSQAIADAKK